MNETLASERLGLTALPRVASAALAIAWAAAPRQLALSIGLRLASGATLGAVLILGPLALNGAREHGDKAPALVDLLPGLAAIALLLAAVSVIGAAGREARALLAAAVARHAQEEILSVTAAVELVAYDSPTFQDRLRRAAMGAQLHPLQVVDGLLGVVGSVAGIFAISVALATVQAWLVPLVLIAAGPLLLAAVRAGDAMFGMTVEMTAADRERAYLFNLLTEKPAAAEIRAFDAAAWLGTRHSRLYDDYLVALRATSRRRLLLSLQGAAGASAILAGAITLLLWLALNDQISVGTAGLALGSVMLLAERLFTGMLGVGALYESACFVADLSSFLAVAPALMRERSRAPAPDRFEGLVTDDLSFIYPGGARPAVENVSLEIRAGEVVALVGENGSGKSTLAKLLARLYLPTSGQVQLDGIDTSTFDPVSFRRLVAVVFQDFMHYALPARENVAIADQDRGGDETVLAAQAAGIDDVLAALPAGYETILSPEFAGGVDLSIGQWQRVALARAFLRDAPLLILDEPTAALDAAAEHALFERVRLLCAGRAVLLISHRLSSVRLADRIYVMDRGRVIEVGSHHELMSSGGRYAELFSLQAAAYISEVTI